MTQRDKRYLSLQRWRLQIIQTLNLTKSSQLPHQVHSRSMPASRTRKSKRRAAPYAVAPSTCRRSDVKGPSEQNQATKAVEALPSSQIPPPSTPSAPLFKVASYPNKGKSSFATISIPPGTRLVDEPPLFSIPQNNPRAEDIELHIYTLPPFLRKQFRALSSGARASTDYSRFVTNSIQMSGTEQGVFPQTSRFNHSCVPNGYFGFDPLSGRVRIHSLVPIKENEEIVINYGYGGLYIDRQQRNRALRPYGFLCDCVACQPRAPKDLAIESRRKQMGILQSKIDRNNSDHPDRIAELGTDLRTLAELLESAASEGDVMYTALADTYQSLTQWYHSESLLAYCDDDFERERECMGLAVQAAERKLQLDILATVIDTFETAKAKIILEGERKSLASLG